MEAHSDLRVRVRRLVCCQGLLLGVRLGKVRAACLVLTSTYMRQVPVYILVSQLSDRSFVDPLKENSVATVRRHRHR